MRKGTVFAATASAKKKLPEYEAKRAEKCKAKGGCPSCPPKPAPVLASKAGSEKNE